MMRRGFSKRVVSLALASLMLIQSPAICLAEPSQSGTNASDGQHTSGNLNTNKVLLGYGFRLSFVDATGNLYTWRDKDGKTHRTTGVDVLSDEMWSNVKSANKLYVMKYSTDGKNYSNRKWPKTVTDNNVYKSKTSLMSWDAYSASALKYSVTGADMPAYTARGRHDADSTFNTKDKAGSSAALLNMIQNGGKADEVRDENSVAGSSFKLMIEASVKAFENEAFGATKANKDITTRYRRSTVAMIAMNTWKCAKIKKDNASAEVSIKQEGGDNVIQYKPNEQVFTEEGAKPLYNRASVYSEHGVDYFKNMTDDEAKDLVKSLANVKRQTVSYSTFKNYFVSHFSTCTNPDITDKCKFTKDNWQASQDLVYDVKYLWSVLTGKKVSIIGKEASSRKYVKKVDDALGDAISAYKNYQANSGDSEAEEAFNAAVKSFNSTRKNYTNKYKDFIKNDLMYYYKSLIKYKEDGKLVRFKLDYAISSLHMTSLESNDKYTKSVYLVAEPILAIGKKGGTIYTGTISEFKHNASFQKYGNYQNTFVNKQVAKSMFPLKTVPFSGKHIKNYKKANVKTQKITYKKSVIKKASYTSSDVKKHLGIMFIGARTSTRLKSPSPKPVPEEEEPKVTTRTIKCHENTTVYLNGSITVKSENASFTDSEGYVIPIEMGQPGTLGKVVEYRRDPDSWSDYNDGSMYWHFSGWKNNPAYTEVIPDQTKLNNLIAEPGDANRQFESNYKETDNTYYWYAAACFTFGDDKSKVINSETNAGLPDDAWQPLKSDPSKLMVTVSNDDKRYEYLDYFTPLEVGGKQLFYSRVYIPYLPEGVEERTDDVELHIMLVPVSGSTGDPVEGAAKYITKKFDLKTYQLREDTPHDPTNLDTFDSMVTWKEKDSTGAVKEYTEGKYHDENSNTSEFTQTGADAALKSLLTSDTVKTQGANSSGVKATESDVPGNKKIYEKLFGLPEIKESNFDRKSKPTSTSNTSNQEMCSAWITRAPDSVTTYNPANTSKKNLYIKKHAAKQIVERTYNCFYYYSCGGINCAGRHKEYYDVTVTKVIWYDAVLCPWESSNEVHVVTASDPDISVVPNPDGNLTATKDSNKNWTIKSGYGIYTTASSELKEDVYTANSIVPSGASGVKQSIAANGGTSAVNYSISKANSYDSLHTADANATNLGDNLFINSTGSVDVRAEDKNKIATSAIFDNGSLHAISAQNATFWFPEMNYSYKFRMGDRVDKKSTFTPEDKQTVLNVLHAKSNNSFKGLSTITDVNDSTLFAFRRNKFSVNYRRLHFLPLWYPDSKNGEYYQVYGELTDIWTPTGMMTFKMSSGNDLRVKGSMWDDYKATVTEDSSVDDVEPDVDKDGNVLH